MPQGYLLLTLHAHLPFVRHPESEDYLEEQWLFEAITETYFPLLQVFDRLQKENIPYPLTLSLSPPLLSMLNDPLLQQRYVKYLDLRLKLLEKEKIRTRGTVFAEVSAMYRHKLTEIRRLFVEVYQGNLIQAFKKHSHQLNLITCAATHGFLPFLSQNPACVKAQIGLAVDCHQRLLGEKPQGIWIPECAYYTGLEEILAQFGLKYFFLETHGLLFARPRPAFGIYAPAFCPNKVAVFGRDPESSRQVWSSAEGYPGDYDYREFYRDLGFDLDYDYIKPYIHKSGIRTNTGLKYHRITGSGEYKEVYNPNKARHKAYLHARNFLFNRTKQAEYVGQFMSRTPLIVCPYDAELFGHWWYEGPQWLEFVCREIWQTNLELITPRQYLQRYPENQILQPCPSSWGENGYYQVWLEGNNHWIYRHLHQAGQQMTNLAAYYPQATGIIKRALNQAARELLLAQSSDWAFILHTRTMTDYALRRTKTHLDNFFRLVREMEHPDEINLRILENQNNIFPEIDYRYYQ